MRARYGTGTYASMPIVIELDQLLRPRPSSDPADH
eukprot:COSAG01_NODE_4593_length_4892_cov_3.056541_2_plen_35_part_00